MAKFKAHYVPYEHTHSFSDLVLDYVQHDASIKPFIADFPSLGAIEKKAIEKKHSLLHREIIVQVLKEQYHSLGIKGVDEQIEKLNKDHAFTICTAHQPNIFTGYLYVIYKIVHAIKLAKAATEESEKNEYLPVFFIGSEDNDIDEIGTFFFKNKKYTWKPEAQGACGRFSTQSLIGIRDEILSQLGDSIAENELKEKVRDAYNGTNSLSQATHMFLHSLFGQYGLLIIDADDARLKDRFKEILEKELEEQISFNLVKAQLEKLRAHYKAQVEPREINLFYLDDGRRDRILSYEDGKIQLEAPNSTIHYPISPQYYSPNVILRPLYQELLLPNVAFIGGGSEVAYWLELKKLFDYFQLPFPIVYLRNSVAFVSAKTSKKMNAFQHHEYFNEIDEVLKDSVLDNIVYAELVSKLAAMDLEYEQTIKRAKTVNASLEVSAQAQVAKIKKIHHRLLQKYRAQLKTKEIGLRNKLNDIQAELFPAGVLQERYENYLSLVHRFKMDIIPVLMDVQDGRMEAFLLLEEQ